MKPGIRFRFRTISFVLGRLIAMLLAALVICTLLNRDAYKDFYDKKLFKLHTADLKSLANQMTIKLNYFLAQGDGASVQSVLDESFGLFGFVVTDCTTQQRTCPEQKILFASDRNLAWDHFPTVDELNRGSFALLRQPPGVRGSFPTFNQAAGNIIGRLYVISNLPQSFMADYLKWIRAPFSDMGVRRIYLRTTVVVGAGTLILWLMTEAYLLIRRKQRYSLLQREQELRTSVDTYLRQLSEKDAQLTKVSQKTEAQYEEYVKNIRSLEKKIRNEEEYRELAEQIINELEEVRSTQSRDYQEELEKTRREMELLQNKIVQFESAPHDNRDSSYKVLEEAVRPRQFSNVFEQRIFEKISSSEQYLREEWRLLNNYDVAPGRNYRQFTDFILINKDALVILEAKYYVGVIESPGDFLNDIWISNSTQQKRIDCLWGENPYHQINEYSMSLMKILKQRSPWMFQIFGVIVFPDEADIAKVGEHLGKFYRVTTVGKLLPLLESIHAEARRFQASKNPKRPKPEQVEEMLRGRKVSP